MVKYYIGKIYRGTTGLGEKQFDFSLWKIKEDGSFELFRSGDCDEILQDFFDEVFALHKNPDLVESVLRNISISIFPEIQTVGWSLVFPVKEEVICKFFWDFSNLIKKTI